MRNDISEKIIFYWLYISLVSVNRWALKYPHLLDNVETKELFIDVRASFCIWDFSFSYITLQSQCLDACSISHFLSSIGILHHTHTDRTKHTVESDSPSPPSTLPSPPPAGNATNATTTATTTNTGGGGGNTSTTAVAGGGRGRQCLTVEEEALMNSIPNGKGTGSFPNWCS